VKGRLYGRQFFCVLCAFSVSVAAGSDPFCLPVEAALGYFASLLFINQRHTARIRQSNVVHLAVVASFGDSVISLHFMSLCFALLKTTMDLDRELQTAYIAYEGSEEEMLWAIEAKGSCSTG